MNNNKIDQVTLARIRKEREKTIARSVAAPGLFLDTWKKAVNLAGERFFTNNRDYQVASTADEATDKWQLIPVRKTIDNYLGVASTGEALFIAALYSFYNGRDGEKMIQELGYSGLGDIANRLEYDQLEIITTLMKYHTGW